LIAGLLVRMEDKLGLALTTLKLFAAIWSKKGTILWLWTKTSCQIISQCDATVGSALCVIGWPQRHLHSSGTRINVAN